MKTLFSFGRPAPQWLIAALLLTACSLPAAELKLRLSFKFILNASGNRPATGNINTDAEIAAQITRANEIYRNHISEFRHLQYEVLDVSGQSAYYLNTASEADRDEIRNAAIANPGAFFWRNNAINIYITGANGSAISKFPPDNDIIILCQGIYDTTLAHEAGHSLNLYHTHETAGADGGDECADTLFDDSDWTSRDQMAQNAYGLNYNQLNASQQAAVDRTFDNLMSYHDPDNRSALTGCQMDRESSQGYSDRTWLLTKFPTYIRVGAPTVPFVDMGSWSFPYPTIQDAINAGETASRVLVLMTSLSHPNPISVINTDTDIVTRRGASVCQEKSPAYQLPYNVEDSTNAAVRAAVLQAQHYDKLKDPTNALSALKQAAQAAVGGEQDALLLEIAQRLQSMSRFTEAEIYYTRLATEAGQTELRTKARQKSERMKVLEQQRLQTEQAQKSDNSPNQEDQQ